MNRADATVVRVIDGDTVLIQIRARLRRSAAELNTPRGKLAKRTLEKELPAGMHVPLSIHGVDVYGRLVASEA